MSVNPDSFVRNVIELDAAIRFGHREKIDKKIKEVINQLCILRPETSPAIWEMFEKIDFSQMPTRLDPSGDVYFLSESFEHIIGVEKDILAIVSKALPELNIHTKLAQQTELAHAMLEARDKGNMERLKEILKESVELNVTSHLSPFATWLGAIKDLPQASPALKASLLKLLLQSGADISGDTKASAKSKKAVMDLIFRPDSNVLDEELLELLISRGLDLDKDGDHELRINIGAPKDKELLIFYGAGRKGGKDYSASTYAALALREDVLYEINSRLPPAKQLDPANMTIPQRREVAKLCLAKVDFRNEWSKNTQKPVKKAVSPPALSDGSLEAPPLLRPLPILRTTYITRESDIKASAAAPPKKPKDNPEIQNLVKEHEAFLNACLVGDYKLAGSMLKEGRIDINAPLVRNEKGHFLPLIVDAFDKGHMPLLEWLLENGANPNAFAYDKNFVPFGNTPIINALQCYTELPTSEFFSHVVNLLLKHKADINVKNIYGKPCIMDHLKGLIHKDPQHALGHLIECGLDLNLKYGEKGLIDGSSWTVEELIALIYYGYDMAGAHFKLQKLTHEDFAKMVTKELLKEDALMMMSADLVGAIASYKPFSQKKLSREFIADAIKLRAEVLAEMVKEGLVKAETPITGLTPKQRLELANRCYAKTKAKAKLL